MLITIARLTTPRDKTLNLIHCRLVTTDCIATLFPLVWRASLTVKDSTGSR